MTDEIETEVTESEDITVNGVTLNIPEFLGLFPHLSEAYTAEKLTDDSIQFRFETVAEQFGSVFPYDPEHGVNTRKRAYYLATCHLCTLALWPAGQSGRVASASQGSVSTSFDLVKANRWLSDYWLQTPCGAQFWALTASYRRGGRVYAGGQYHPWG